MMACIEDEWHVFFVCPLYASLRRMLPFTAHDALVEGHAVQGDGCTTRNLRALVRAMLQTSKFDAVVDFLL